MWELILIGRMWMFAVEFKAPTPTAVSGGQKLKVCHVYFGGISPEKGGGVASYLHGLISTSCGVVDYFLLAAYDKNDLDNAAGLYDHKVRIISVRLTNPFLDIISLAKFHRIFSVCDVVHFNDFYGSRDIFRCLLLMLVLKASNVKLVFGFRTAGIEESINNSVLRGVYSFLFRRLSKSWDRITCASRYSADLLVGRYGFPADKISVIPNGVDVELYKDAKASSLGGNPAILCVGHLQPAKGTDLAIRAFKFVNDEISESRLHLVGTGPYEREYREMISKLHINTKVVMHGRKSRNELSRIYKGADMCVFPTRVESFGNVVLEAMASGKPIVASNVGGVPEVMEQERNGLLVEPTVTNIGKALLRLAHDRGLCERISKNNRHDVMQHSWKRMSETYVRLYGQICGRDKHS
jgi:glycosyltransferase involved in cell wall biosynthesis